MIAAHFVYRVLLVAEWHQLLGYEEFTGNESDRRDGYIHLSSREQVPGTLHRHFFGVTDVVVVELDTLMLGDKLRWETSRHDQLFPHLYDKVPLSAVVRTLDPAVFDRTRQFAPATQLDLVEKAFPHLLRKKR